MRTTSGASRRFSKTSGPKSYGSARILRFRCWTARASSACGCSERRAGAGVRLLRSAASSSSRRRRTTARDKPGNNDSLAFRVSFGSRSFLLTGDMERPMEARLLGDGLAAHADVLKVGHHGSKTSSIQPFLDAVSPSVAIISAGYENSFGHPHPDVLKRLAGSACGRPAHRSGRSGYRLDRRPPVWFDRWRGSSGRGRKAATKGDPSHPDSGTIRAATGAPDGALGRTVRFAATRVILASTVLAVSFAGMGLALCDADADDADQVVDQYLDAAKIQQEALRGVQMEVDIDAQLPKLKRTGKLKVLRIISRLGKITFKKLGEFVGDPDRGERSDRTVPGLEQEGRENGSIAITPRQLQVPAEDQVMTTRRRSRSEDLRLRAQAQEEKAWGCSRASCGWTPPPACPCASRATGEEPLDLSEENLVCRELRNAGRRLVAVHIECHVDTHLVGTRGVEH